MKTGMFLVVFILVQSVSFSQQTYIPDTNFETYLETHDASGAPVPVGDPSSMGNGIANDMYVATANISTVTHLDVNNQNISDLTGIEDFSSLIQLVCRNNSLTTLDISQNTSLEDLYCQFNQISSLDTTQNSLLKKLYAYNNYLSSLNVSQNTLLTHLVVNSNQITALDVTQNVNLLTLEFHSNQISTIDLTQNTVLVSLKAGNNSLSSLDLSNNINLGIAQIENNQIATLNLTPSSNFLTLLCENNLLSSLDLSLFTSFGYLKCHNNLLTSLNVKNGNNVNFSHFDSTNNPNLTCIEVDNATWSASNWTNVDSSSTFVNNQAECATLSNQEFDYDKVDLYPNPAGTTFYVTVKHKANYELIGINGQILKTGSLQIGENKVDISNFQSGVYLLKVNDERKIYTSKVYKR